MAFGLPNPDDHALTLQVGQAEGAEFSEPEPGGIEGGKDRAMLQVARGRKDGSDLCLAENRGKLPRPPGIGDVLEHPLVPEGGVIEEAQGTDGLIEEGPGDLTVMGEVGFPVAMEK